MLRLVELALFLAPFVIFAAWRFAALEGGPSIKLLIGAVCLLALLGGLLVWLRQDETLPPDAAYAPAQLHDGEVVSGHPVTR